MSLKSELFKDNQRLQDCLIKDSARIMLGAQGEHVGKIQQALMIMDKSLNIDDELKQQYYGHKTAQAVQNYKANHNPPIINRSYQSQADNIVGKMTIQALDEELFKLNQHPSNAANLRVCQCSEYPYKDWPTDLLNILCRSYKVHGEIIDGYLINSLPEAFCFDSKIEPINFDDALKKAYASRLKIVFDHSIAYPQLWSHIEFIFGTWQTDNTGFKFSFKNLSKKESLKTYLDNSNSFARDIPEMQYFHQLHNNKLSKLLVPTHQCWREVVANAPGLHICINNNSIFENEIHLDATQIVKGKKSNGTCEYDAIAAIKHGIDIKEIVGL